MTSFEKMKENASRNDKTVVRAKTLWKTGNWMFMRKGDTVNF